MKILPVPAALLPVDGAGSEWHVNGAALCIFV